MNIFYLISVMGSRILNLLTIVLLSYLMPAEPFGQFSLIMANGLALYIILVSWIPGILWRDVSQAEAGTHSVLIARAAQTALLPCLLMLAAAVIFVAAAGPDQRFAAGALMMAPLILLFEISAVILNASRDERSHAALNLTRGLLALLAGPTLTWFGFGLWTVIGSQIIAIMAALFAIPAVRRIWSGVRGAASKSQFSIADMKFGTVSALSIYLYMLSNTLCRNLVAWKFGAAEAGYFGVASDIFYAPIALFATTLSLTSVPGLYRGDKDQLDRNSSEFLLKNMAVIIPYCAAAPFVTPWLAEFVFQGANGDDIARLAPISAFQGGCFVLLSTFTTIALTQKKVRRSLTISLQVILALFSALLFGFWSGFGENYPRIIVATLAICSVGALFAYRNLFQLDSVGPELVRITVASAAMASILLLFGRISSPYIGFLSIFAAAAVYLSVGVGLQSSIIRSIIPFLPKPRESR